MREDVCLRCGTENGYQPMHGPFECLNLYCDNYSAEHARKHAAWVKKKMLEAGTDLYNAGPIKPAVEESEEKTDPGIGPVTPAGQVQQVLDFFDSFSDPTPSKLLDSIAKALGPKAPASSKYDVASLGPEDYSIDSNG